MALGAEHGSPCSPTDGDGDVSSDTSPLGVDPDRVVAYVPAMDITERQGTMNGLSFTWLEAGDADGPLALCQHGFPDSPWGWRRLLPKLAAAGFHAVAPYARGYARNRGSREWHLGDLGMGG